MFPQLQNVITRNCALNKDEPIIVGVSGGADSLALLEILLRDYNVVVAHFNHQIRPKSKDDARAVEWFAAKKSLPFALGEKSVLEYAQERSLSVEEAARKLRYRFLFEQASQFNAQAVAVAHNADDQVETVLMHLLRGAGLDGLSGMAYRLIPNPWSEKIPLVRPLLGIWRSEIEGYIKTNDLSPLSDETNKDTTYFRNRIRKELIPELATYVPGIRNRLWRTAELIANDQYLLNNLTDEIWEEIIYEMGTGYIIIRMPLFLKQPLGMQRRLIRKIISYLRPGGRDVDFAIIKRALGFVENPTLTRQADLGLGLRISQEENHIIISDWDSERPKDQWPQITNPSDLSIPGELELGSGWVLRTDLSLDGDLAIREAQENSNPLRAWIDLGEHPLILKIRPRISGDRFKPLGMNGKSMKISDFMTNQKIPVRLRAKWPLVCLDDEIVWVPGYRLGHSFRITERTQRVLKLKLHHR